MRKYFKTSLLLLIIIDIGFILIHIVREYSSSSLFLDEKFLVTTDGGYSEYYQYLKYILSVVILFTLAYRRNSRLLFSWMLLCVFFLFDDAIMIHEGMGKIFAGIINQPVLFGLPSDSIGEVIGIGIVGFFFLILIGSQHVICTDIKIKEISQKLFLLLILLLLFFAVFMDVIHELRPESRPVALIEDGGEMIVLSVTLAYLIAIQKLYRDAGMLINGDRGV